MFVREKKVKACDQSTYVMQKQAQSLENQQHTGHRRKVSRRLDSSLLLQYTELHDSCCCVL